MGFQFSLVRKLKFGRQCQTAFILGSRRSGVEHYGKSAILENAAIHRVFWFKIAQNICIIDPKIFSLQAEIEHKIIPFPFLKFPFLQKIQKFYTVDLEKKRNGRVLINSRIISAL